MESGEDNIEVQQEWEGKQALNLYTKDKGRVEENVKPSFNHDNIDTNILRKFVELIKKDILPKFRKQRKIDRMILKDQIG